MTKTQWEIELFLANIVLNMEGLAQKEVPNMQADLTIDMKMT